MKYIFILILISFSVNASNIFENQLNLGINNNTANKTMQFGNGAAVNKGCLRFNYATTRMQYSDDCSSYVNFTGITPIFEHNQLYNINGGTTNDYYHLTFAQNINATQRASSTTMGLLDNYNFDYFYNKANISYVDDLVNNTNNYLYSLIDNTNKYSQNLIDNTNIGIQSQLANKASIDFSNIVPINSNIIPFDNLTWYLGSPIYKFGGAYLGLSYIGGMYLAGTNIQPTDASDLTLATSGAGKIKFNGVDAASLATTAYVDNINFSDLNDVAVSSPQIDQVPRWNGTKWVNSSGTSSGAAPGITLYLDDTTLVTGTTNNTNIFSLLNFPNTSISEQTDSISVTAQTLLDEAYLLNSNIGGGIIDAGEWVFNFWAGANVTAGVNELLIALFKASPQIGTIDISGTGATRTATAIGSTPFISTDSNANIVTTSYLQLSNGFYPITGFSSSSSVTIGNTTGLANTNNAYSIYRHLFDVTTGDLPAAITFEEIFTAQPQYNINTGDKLSVLTFGRTDSGTPKVISFTHNGQSRYSHIHTPLSVRHDNLLGLSGCDINGTCYHLDNDNHINLISRNPSFNNISLSGNINNTASSLMGLNNFPVGSMIFYCPGYFTNSNNGGYTYALGAANTEAAINTILNSYGWYVANGAALNDASSPIFNAVGRFLPNMNDNRVPMGNNIAGSPGGVSLLPTHTHGLDSSGGARINVSTNFGSGITKIRKVSVGPTFSTINGGTQVLTTTTPTEDNTNESGIDSAALVGVTGDNSTAPSILPTNLKCFWIIKVK